MKSSSVFPVNLTVLKSLHLRKGIIPTLFSIFCFIVNSSFNFMSNFDSIILSELPDLVVTDIWEESNQICYQIFNQGTAISAAGQESRLYVDTLIIKVDVIQEEIAPQARLERCFDFTWTCSSPQDEIGVCADELNTIEESDENNNCRSESWKCDQTAPQILEGPIVLEIEKTSAKVIWQTDEISQGLVEYSQKMNAFDLQSLESETVEVHEVILADLTPGAIYQVRVKSIDPSGNSSVSAPIFFTTLPLGDEIPPEIQPVDIERKAGEFVSYSIDIPVSDNQAIDWIKFSLDDQLVGMDYAPNSGTSNYQFTLSPGALGLSHMDFFDATHVLDIQAKDRSGLISNFGSPWTPEAESMDGVVEIVAPAPDHTLFVTASYVNYSITLPIQVYALENDLEICLPPGVGGDLECEHHTRAVSQVEFFINGELKYTSISSGPDQEIHEYLWDLFHLPVGDYTILVNATAEDGTTLSVSQQYYIRTGIIDLDVERQVSLQENWLQVRLIFDNIGDVRLLLRDFTDTLSGFQVLPKSTEIYSLQSTFNYWTLTSQVEIAIALGHPLDPGEELIIEYIAIPIRTTDRIWEGYAIGTEPIEIAGIYDYRYRLWTFNLPATLTTEGLTLDEAVSQTIANADYLIVTNPELLYFHNAAHDRVDNLLSLLAELTVVKNGSLAYLQSHIADTVVDDAIEEWGREMKGSDGMLGGFLNNGYLLLVGEDEIIPSNSYTLTHWYLDNWTIELTDAAYADTASNLIDPELMVGRIVGDNAAELIIPINTLINVYQGSSGYSYDYSGALLVSGWPECRSLTCNYSDFLSRCRQVQSKLDMHGIPSYLLETTDFYTEEDGALNIVARMLDIDLVFLAGHGSSDRMDDLQSSNLDMVSDLFGEANPIVFVASCLTGSYTDRNSLMEKFLQKGAGVYLGATDVSPSGSNTAASNAIYQRLTPGRAFGSIVNEVKTGFGTGDISGYFEDIWTLEYLYSGDPEYGSDIPGALSSIDILEQTKAITETTTLQVNIPDLQVHNQSDGSQLLEIPGGGWVQVPERPMTPYYLAMVDIDPLVQVKDVRMVQRSNQSTFTGLSLPVFDLAQDNYLDQMNQTNIEEVERWPEVDFYWRVEQNPDGSGKLILQIHSLLYNPLTLQAEFFQDYTFDILTEPRAVRLVEMIVSPPVSSGIEKLNIDLRFLNDGQPWNGLVGVSLRNLGDGIVVASLPIQQLKGLAGNATWSTEVDISALPEGDYIVEAELYDELGKLMDTRQENLKIGLSEASIEDFCLSTLVFDPLETVDMGYTLSNSGSITLNGTALFEVQNLGTGEELVFEIPFSDLIPGQSLSVSTSWHTQSSDQGYFQVLAYAHFSSNTTAPQTINLQSTKFIFFPLITR